ncbi:ribonuclease H-like domain-containing protein [Nemania serpens]|nr:ribonuclease H-like domain-containing protein [Nemania serpens]
MSSLLLAGSNDASPQYGVLGLIDTPEAVSSVIDELSELPEPPSSPPSIYMDLEGINLCRYGTVSILQVYSRPRRKTYLVDIMTLGKAAFETSGTRTSNTLQSILESEDIPKVFFDVRRDSDALFAHFQIKLRGIHDLQLMELATRKYPKKSVAGLRQCILSDLKLKETKRRDWMAAKEAGSKLFAPEKGGSYEVFNLRPLPEEIRAYCIQDVSFLPLLWLLYHSKLRKKWKNKLDKATRDRVSESQAENYEPKGPHNLLAPAGWRSW